MNAHLRKLKALQNKDGIRLTCKHSFRKDVGIKAALIGRISLNRYSFPHFQSCGKTFMSGESTSTLVFEWIAQLFNVQLFGLGSLIASMGRKRYSFSTRRLCDAQNSMSIVGTQVA